MFSVITNRVWTVIWGHRVDSAARHDVRRQREADDSDDCGALRMARLGDPAHRHRVAARARRAEGLARGASAERAALAGRLPVSST